MASGIELEFGIRELGTSAKFQSGLLTFRRRDLNSHSQPSRTALFSLGI
jgi:hypothetical protein